RPRHLRGRAALRCLRIRYAGPGIERARRSTAGRVRAPILRSRARRDRVAVVVFALPIALVQPLLVLALELVVEDQTLDARVTLFEPVRDAEICPVDLRV